VEDVPSTEGAGDGEGRRGKEGAGARARDAEELVDKREYKLKRRLRSQTLRHMVTFLITVRSPEVVIRSAIIPPSKYSRHESSIRDVEIACGASGYLRPPDTLHLRPRSPSQKFLRGEPPRDP
jgi:hypothetical protein